MASTEKPPQIMFLIKKRCLELLFNKVTDLGILQEKHLRTVAFKIARLPVVQIILFTKFTSSQSWTCELDEGRSLCEINFHLWTYKDVINKLL